MLFRPIAAATALLLLVTIQIQPSSAAGDVTWLADPGHSLAEFSVLHLGFTHVRGSIIISQASIVAPAGSNVPSSIAATLDAASIDTRNADRDKDLRGPQWLDVTTFKTIAFKSSSVVAGPNDTFTAAGDFTLHGVTKPVTLAGHVDGTSIDGRGHHRVSYSATTTIKRQDYGLNWAQQTPGGTFIAGDNVDISITIEAVAQ